MAGKDLVMAGYIVAGMRQKRGRLHSHPSLSLADVLVPARRLGRVHGKALRRSYRDTYLCFWQFLPFLCLVALCVHDRRLSSSFCKYGIHAVLINNCLVHLCESLVSQ
jgi:hypothetical protein